MIDSSIAMNSNSSNSAVRNTIIASNWGAVEATSIWLNQLRTASNPQLSVRPRIAEKRREFNSLRLYNDWPYRINHKTWEWLSGRGSEGKCRASKIDVLAGNDWAVPCQDEKRDVSTSSGGCGSSLWQWSGLCGKYSNVRKLNKYRPNGLTKSCGLRKE